MIENQRHRFDIPAEIAWLNCAYMSPLMDVVRDAGLEGVVRKQRPWEIMAEDFFLGSERARSLFARLIGARPNDVALIPAASYGVALAAQHLPLSAEQRVLVLDEQFPSNVYAWQARAKAVGAEVIFAPRSPGGWTQSLLARLDERVAIVAVPHGHWTDGAAVDLAIISRHCQELGASLVVDATQSLGAVPLSVSEIPIDYLITASYKWLLGPYSMGFAYVAPRWQDCVPLEHNWISRAGSENFGGLVRYRDDFQPGARRFDVGGRSNFALIPMVAAALEQLLIWGVDEINASLQKRTTQIADHAAALGLRVTPKDQRLGHMLGLRFPDGAHAGIAERLKEAGVFVSVRGDAIRVSPHLYNTDEDVQRFLNVLQDETR